MASHKIAAMLRATGQFSEKEIEALSEEEAWEWLRSNTTMTDTADDGSCNVDDT